MRTTTWCMYCYLFIFNNIMDKIVHGTEYVQINNFSGGSGYLLCTKYLVEIKKGDQYIGEGLAGSNIFTYILDSPRMAIKVVARSSNLTWEKSGNNNIESLPVLDL